MARRMARNRNRGFMAGRPQEDKGAVWPGTDTELSAVGMSPAFIGRAVGSEV